jgi:hypothetical protein
VRAGIWGPIGAVGGLAFAIGMRQPRRALDAMIGACLGAVLATVLFHCSGEMFFPDARSAEPLAASPTVRLLAMMLVSILQAIGATWFAVRGLSRPVSADQPSA